MRVLTLEWKKFLLSKDFKQKLSEISGLESVKKKMDYLDKTGEAEEEMKYPKALDIHEERKLVRSDSDTTY